MRGPSAHRNIECVCVHVFGSFDGGNEGAESRLNTKHNF